jgi:hypothetical protein
MKSKLSILLGLSLLAQVSLSGADEAKKPAADAAKVAVKAAAPKAPAQPADVAAPKVGADGKINAGFQKQHDSFVEIAKKGEAQVVFLGDSSPLAGTVRRPSSKKSMPSIRPLTSASVATAPSMCSGASRTVNSKALSRRSSSS